MAIDRRRTGGSYLPLRDAIDRLFEGSFISPHMLTEQVAFPPANLHVTDDDIILEMSVPGVSPENINVSVTGDTVTISGESTKERREDKSQTYVEEMWHGHFQRSFTLPFAVSSDMAQATVENGVLNLTFPKSEEARPRKIQVSGRTPLAKQTEGTVEKERVPVTSVR